MNEYDDHSNYEECSEALKSTVQAWIAMVFQPAKSVYHRMDSHGLKHRFEYSVANCHANLYISNGEFKGAMLAAGYKPVDKDLQNWEFKVKPRSSFARFSNKHWECSGEMEICLCHCTQQERDHYADLVASAVGKPPVYVHVPVKRVQHKQTLPPWECHHCHLVWYGTAYDGDRKQKMVVPTKKVLCHKCNSALENYLLTDYKHFYANCYNNAAALTQTHAIAEQWIADPNHQPLRRPYENRYKSVPQWMRSAIEQGKVATNTKDVYVVTEENGVAVEVEVLAPQIQDIVQ